jgi:hypothetical protein
LIPQRILIVGGVGLEIADLLEKCHDAVVIHGAEDMPRGEFDNSI